MNFARVENLNYDIISVINQHEYKSYSLDEIHKKCNNGENFIFPIIMFDTDLFTRYDTIELPENIVLGIKSKIGKLVFILIQEPWLGVLNSDFIWIDNLCKKYQFTKESVIVITSNLLAKIKYNSLLESKHIDDAFILFLYDPYNPRIGEGEYEWFLERNRKNKKTHHILCFNRIPKTHRIAMFGELMSNPIYKDKIILSMGSHNISNIEPVSFFNLFKEGFGNIDSDRTRRILRFLSKYDSIKNIEYDTDIETVKAYEVNKEVHNNSFVNVVTESYLSDDTIFFTEKTYKPIGCLQPFILWGNPYSLKKLKELGYKTFDKWWDESYDEELDIEKKFHKICDLTEEIASWDLDKCFRITQEMEETLLHNFNNSVKLRKESQEKIIKLFNLELIT